MRRVFRAGVTIVVLGSLLAAARIALACDSVANHQPDPNPAALVQRAIRALAAEAQQAKKDGTLPRNEADFAKAFGEEHETEIPGHVVWRFFQRPVSRDPFIDAYVRWQLTGFEPEIPDENALDPEDFERVLADLPDYQQNPGSEEGLISQVNRAVNRERLSEDEAEIVARLNETLQTQRRRAERFNRPAGQLRVWIEQAVGDRGIRIHQVRLERAASMVQAGWNVDPLKREIQRGFAQAAEDQTLAAEQRRRIASQAMRLAGMRTPIVTRISVNQEAAQAQFDETAIYDFEVSAWIRALQGR